MKTTGNLIKGFVLCFTISEIIAAEKCKTPNGEEAECVPIRSCSILVTALLTLESESIEFVKKSQCGNDTGPLVCCGTSNTYVTTTTSATIKDDKMKLLPDRRYCGYQRFDDYLHTDGTLLQPTIDEFPWVAALVYNSGGKIRISCTGSLISKKYVLTVAHCIITENGDKLISVKLGEYNILQEMDCVKDDRFDSECTDPITTFGIEETILHPRYNTLFREHNIALLRLNQTVTYSDFIRPICLPFPGTKFASVGDTLYQSGWGFTSSDAVQTAIKKKISVKLLPLELCEEEYKGGPVIVTENHICTAEPSNSTRLACQGDSGGPVMFVNRNQWHQEGIIAFGKGCRYAPTGTPGVNMKVVNYLDWIIKNIRP